MLDAVKNALNAGDLAAARLALARALGDYYTAAFVAGRREHPILGPEGLGLVEEIQKIAGPLSADPSRGHYLQEVLHEVGSRMVLHEGRDAVLFLFNHALGLILPDYALLVSDSLENARYELIGRIQEGNSAMGVPFLTAQSALLIMAAAKAFQGLDNARLGSIEGMTLSDLDAPEGVIPDLPALEGIDDEELVFDCPACGGRRRAPVGSAGDTFGCGCGGWTRVPIPGLPRLAEWQKAKRDKARGLSRCRICGAVIQTGRAGPMRAGFCSSSCAMKARDQFGEFVASSASIEGEQVRFKCACGARMEAPSSTVGAKAPCPSCGLQVWVPEPEVKQGRPTLGSCPKCGKAMKSTAVRCLYCGTPKA